MRIPLHILAEFERQRQAQRDAECQIPLYAQAGIYEPGEQRPVFEPGQHHQIKEPEVRGQYDF